MSDYAARLKNTIIEGMAEETEAVCKEALSELEPTAIIEIMAEAADELGDRFQKGELFLPELICGAEAMNQVITLVTPLLIKGGGKFMATIIIGSVEGDIHDIGKRIVISMLTSAGFNVIDLGIDVPAKRFIQAIEEEKPEIVAASAYITTTAPQLKYLENALKEAGLRDKVKYLIGGASVSNEMKELFNADGYGENAVEAVKEAKRLIKDLRGN